MKIPGGLISFLVCAVISGCTTSPQVEFIEKGHVLAAGRGAEPPAMQSVVPRQPVTQAITIIADTQIHESRGTASRYFSLAGDEFVSVTIRTGQQTIGAADILADVLQRERTSPLVLHLGDAIDVSCETEWDLYSTAMSQARGTAGPRSWLFSPGNHDGFFVGNFSPLDGQLYNKGYWNEVCNTGRLYDKTRRYGLAKDKVIAQYRESLQQSGALPSIRTGRTTCTGDPVLYCAFVHTSKYRPWTSFIVQAVQLPASQPAAGPPVFALLLDTSDYATQPKPALGAVFAGVDAGLSVQQLAAAESILQALPPQARVFFAGHHPFWAWKANRWRADARSALKRVLHHPKSLHFVVTAHTHEGGWAEHTFEGKPLLELNTGSLIDWPVYYRDLKFEIDAEGRLYAASSRHSESASIRDDCDFLVIPPANSRYGIDAQRSESDRESSSGSLVRWTRSAFNAFGHFGKFWRAKHIELGAQLLAYADVVDYSMSADESLIYRVPDRRPVILTGKSDIAAKLRALALCEDKKRCPAQEKETVLYALERYYWSPTTPETTRSRGHAYRRCAALWASSESAMKSPKDADLVKKIVARTALSVRMLPP